MMKRKEGFEALEGIRKLSRVHREMCRAFLWFVQTNRRMESKAGRGLNEVARDIDRLYTRLEASFPGSLWLSQAKRIVKRVDARAKATMEQYDSLTAHRRWVGTLKGGE